MTTPLPRLDRSFDRRRFLQVGVTAAGALALELRMSGLLWGEDGVAPFTPAAFVTIHPDGRVLFRVPVPELGQGVRTSLPMILAEELGADWSQIEVEQAPLAERFGPRQLAGGSGSVRAYWGVLRRAGAVARELLIGAAAERWRVPADQCHARHGRIEHPASGRSLPFGELTAEAGRRPAPDAATVPLKDPREFTLLGTPRSNIDRESIVTGRMVFGSDVQVPGQQIAAIVRCPVFGGRVGSVEAEPALAVPGVSGVEVLPPGLTSLRNRVAAGVAVLAGSTAAALEGRRRLRIDWELDREAEEESTAGLRSRMEEALGRPGEIVRDDGDVDAAMSTAARTLEASYELPLLAHAPMEPMVCTASVTGDRCEVWAPTQLGEDVVEEVASATGLAAERITLHHIRAGGGFGRRLNADFAAEAAYLSQRRGHPVRVFWSRPDDQSNGFYRPTSRHRLEGGLDSRGRLVAWRHRHVSTSKAGYRQEGDPAWDSEVDTQGFPIQFVPNLRLEYAPVASPIPRGSWRSVSEAVNVFVVQSFVDELAAAAGADPVDYRLSLLGEARPVPFYTVTYDSGRLSRVVEEAAERSGWGRPLAAGKGRGIAFNFAWGTFVAEVVEVTARDEGSFTVDRVVAVVDPGVVINPLGLRAQFEGGILDGIASAAAWEITLQEGRVEQRNFDRYPLLRIGQVPEIEVHVIEGGDRPGGMGEPPVPPAAPALANALCAATGRRFRRLPLHHEGMRLA